MLIKFTHILKASQYLYSLLFIGPMVKLTSPQRAEQRAESEHKRNTSWKNEYS